MISPFFTDLFKRISNTMRLHRNLILAIIDGLHLTFNEDRYADKVIQILLKRDKRWGAKDRNFIADTFYEIVRFKRLYTEISNTNSPYSREDLWKIVGVWLTLRGIHIPTDWKQLEGTPTRKIKGKFDQLTKERKYKYAIPDWLDQLASQELGSQIWTKEIEALNKPTRVILRTNTLKISRSKLRIALDKEGIYTDILEDYPDALQLQKRQNLNHIECFKQGYFEIQDASSQLVAPFLEVKPKQRIVDTCAGAGGKTLHLSALMENKGQLIALDIFPEKLYELKRRVKRAGAFNIETRAIESSKVVKKLYGKADRVLIDAPCSGLGVLKRNPDTKWKLTPEKLEKVQQTQLEILKQYSRIVNPKGKMVYATCSILPSENQHQIKAFLESEQGKNFKLEKEQTIFAHKSNFDGFYMALLKKQ